jgi:hypothetical protein
MTTQHVLISSFGVLALAGVAACGNDTMSMAEEVDQIGGHQAALELALSGHHREVLDEREILGVRSFEDGFGRTAAVHMDEMDHRMRDMQEMCTMGGRRFDGRSMSDGMRRIREAFVDHRRRMEAIPDLAALHAEEGAFRERMMAPMADMRSRQSEARNSAAGYSCRMHSH